MDPHQNFHWCIHVALRILFKITFRDMFAERPKLSAANFAVIGFFLSVLLGGCYTIIFFDKLTVFLSIVAVFALTQGSYLPVYLVIIFGLFQIITYCVLGTVIKISSNSIYEAIESFDWYLLPPNQRKAYQILLHHSQQPTIIYIAGVRELNLETCVSLIRGIYSFAMVLFSTV